MATTLRRDHPDLPIFAYDLLRQNETYCAQGPKAGEISHVPSPEQLAAEASLIISVVTADQSVQAAQSILPFLTKRHIFADGNSVSPGTKQLTEERLESSGAAYIDMAIMAPIMAKGHKTSLLLAGRDEEQIAPMLNGLGFEFDWEGPDIGQASVVKMLRSILIKGVESLVCESMAAAEGLGLNHRILLSAGKTLGIDDMPKFADYVMERVAVHGRRRSAEMVEVAKTLDELGLSNDMATAIATHQGRIANMELQREFDGAVPQDHAALSALIRAKQQKA